MAVVPSISEVKNIVLKTLNWIKLGMVPVGTIQTGLYTAPPAGYLAFKRTDQILKSQYPALCALLFKINGFKGNGSTYANIPNVDHRVIELASNVSEVGQLIEAGLPDIEGYSDQTGGSNNSYEPSGVFSHNNLLHGQGIATTSDPNATIVGLNFKASKANALYKGSTLQTASLRLLAIIKS